MGMEAMNSIFFRVNSKVYVYVILFIALFLRIVTLDNHGVWCDETWVVTTPTFHYDSESIYPKFFEYPQVKNLPENYRNILKMIYNIGPVTQICFMVASDMHPPFYYIISYYWTRLFGESLYAIRSLPVVIGLISILALYMLVCPPLGEEVALISSGFLAISPMFIHFNQLARNFSLMTLLVILSFMLLFKLYKSFERKFAVLYGIALFLSIFTHYYAIFFVLTQVLIILMLEFRGEKHFLRWVLIFTTVAVCYLPWLPVLYIQMFLRDPTAQSGLISCSVDTLLKQFYSVGFCPSLTDKFVPSFWVQRLEILNICCIGTVLVFGYVKLKPDFKPYFKVICLWAFLPIFLCCCISIIKPLYSIKSLLPVLPAFAILIAMSLVQIKNIKSRYVVIGFGALLIILVQLIWPTYPGIESTEDTRGAVRQLKSSIRESDLVAVQPAFFIDNLWYYLKRDYIGIRTESDFEQIPEAHPNIWLFRFWDKHKSLPIIRGKFPEKKFNFFGVSVYFWENNLNYSKPHQLLLGSTFTSYKLITMAY